MTSEECSWATPHRCAQRPAETKAAQSQQQASTADLQQQKRKHNVSEKEGTNTIQQLAATARTAPADPKSTSAHMPPQMRRKDDQVKNGIATCSKEPAMTRAHHASLQIDEQTNRKPHEHTREASLRYRHRRTDPHNFSPRGRIGATYSMEYWVQRDGMEWQPLVGWKSSPR
jgi:hypothetical protein